MTPTRSRGLWKPILALTLMLLLTGIGTAAWILIKRDKQWATLESRVDALFSGLDAPPLERIALGRTLLPGNAWDDYIAASPYVPGQPPRLIGSKILTWLRRDPKANPEEVDSLLLEFSPSLEKIRTGTRRQMAKVPAPSYTSNGIRYPFNLGYSDMTLLCVGKARQLAESENCSEALELLVDVCLFGRDLAESRMPGGAASGLYQIRTALQELRDMLPRHRFRSQDLEALERALALLDDHFPDHTHDIRADLLELGILLRREDRDDAEYFGFSERESRRNWRYLFSTRIQAGATFFAADDLVQRALALESQPWSVAGPANQALYTERSKNKLIDHRLNHLSCAQWVIPIRADLRLLRMATHYLVSGALLELDDPVGGKIRSRLSQQTILIWKRGVYGRTDWEPKDGKTSYDSGLTIELPRRQ
jgi:hypothetical protein